MIDAFSLALGFVAGGLTVIGWGLLLSRRNARTQANKSGSVTIVPRHEP